MKKKMDESHRLQDRKLLRKSFIYLFIFVFRKSFPHLLSKGQNMIKRVTKYEVDFQSFLHISLSSGSLLNVRER